MTTKSENEGVPTAASLARITENLGKVDALRERLAAVLANRNTHHAALDAPN